MIDLLYPVIPVIGGVMLTTCVFMVVLITRDVASGVRFLYDQCPQATQERIETAFDLASGWTIFVIRLSLGLALVAGVVYTLLPGANGYTLGSLVAMFMFIYISIVVGLYLLFAIYFYWRLGRGQLWISVSPETVSSGEAKVSPGSIATHQ